MLNQNIPSFQLLISFDEIDKHVLFHKKRYMNIGMYITRLK